MKKTPLYDSHYKQGAKMIDFNGWALPIHYSGILEEHQRVRTAAGLFDVSHMGEIAVLGSGAEAFLQNLVTNDIAKLQEGRVIYSPMCFPDGGVVDDLLIYRLGPHDYLVVVNASNTEQDFQWMQGHQTGNVSLQNVSEEYAQLSIQGPRAEDILQKLTPTALTQLRFYRFHPNIELDGIPALVSRTGYTGEDGFELYVAPHLAPTLWDVLLGAGQDEGLVPVGLGARDTLRFEAGLPLYGQEISETITPLESGLGNFVKLDKDHFIGREALLKQQREGIPRALVGFELLDRGVPRSHYPVVVEEKEIGVVTTGGNSPTLKKNIGMALVERAFSLEGTEFGVVIRNNTLSAKIIPKPFVPLRYRRSR